MKFIIKQWPNKSATLMTENGYNLATFNSSAEARQACNDWQKAHQEYRNRMPDQIMIEEIRT